MGLRASQETHMLKPYHPDHELMTLDRIASDSGTGLLYGVTFAVIYVLYVAVLALTALPRHFLGRSAAFVHGWRRHA
jgi:hypothetical protein